MHRNWMARRTHAWNKTVMVLLISVLPSSVLLWLLLGFEILSPESERTLLVLFSDPSQFSRPTLSVIVVSCARYTLLNKSLSRLESLMDLQSVRLLSKTVLEDCADRDRSGFESMKKSWRRQGWLFAETTHRFGLFLELDKYLLRIQLSHIEGVWDFGVQKGADFVLHLEDDWLYYRPGFIEESIRILRDRPENRPFNISKVNHRNIQFRHTLDYKEFCGGPVMRELDRQHWYQVAGESTNYVCQRTSHGFAGFTNSPGMVDAAALRAVGVTPLSEYAQQGYHAEHELSEALQNRHGLRVCFAAPKGYAGHVGRDFISNIVDRTRMKPLNQTYMTEKIYPQRSDGWLVPSECDEGLTPGQARDTFLTKVKLE